MVTTAPADVRLTLPHWTPAELAAAAGPETAVLAAPDADEWASFQRAVAQTQPAGVLLLEAHRFLRWLAFRRIRHDPGPIVALDLLVRDAVFGNPRAYRHGLRARALGAAVASWAARETLVRRRPVGFVSLNGWSDRFGSRRLRRATRPLPDLLEHLPRAAARPKQRPTRVSLVGVLKERKGLADLVAALGHLAGERRLDPSAVEVSVIGGCEPGYEAELERLGRELRDNGFAVDVEIGAVSPETLGGVLEGTDVLVLPYRSHFGGSGFLGSAFDYPQLTVVCSDFGWLGHVARMGGAIPYRNGSTEDLALALELALRDRPRVDAARRVGYAEAEEFGRVVWSSLPPLRR